jgi:uncharacterized protein (TIGR02996 family)
VTTEDDFQKALDANPSDWQTRLVFADWLQERGDERAEGMRALGTLQRVPLPYTQGDKPGIWAGATEFTLWKFVGADQPSRLPAVWFKKIPRDDKNPDDASGHSYRSRPSRRAIEDAAALAFAKLPARCRAGLLAPKGAAPGPRARKKAPRKVRQPAARKLKSKGKK